MKKKSIRSAGRPANAGMSVDTIVDKIEWEFTKASKNSANNLGKYFAVLEEYALGVKGSETNQVSSCKLFIKMAEDYLKENGEGAENSEDTLQEEVAEAETKQVGNGEPVLSFADKVALHKKKQAEKKAE